MQAHPAAKLFPLLDNLELDKLADDIRRNGLREPIGVYEGQVIDGRNRSRACQRAGITPTYVTLSPDDIGHDPVAYVLSLNMARRHLTPSQRAMIGAEVRELYAEEAQVRMLTGKPDPSAALRQGRSSEQAAEQLGVSARSVEKASIVKEAGAPEVSEAVKSGAITINAAEALVRSTPDQQEQANVLAEAVATPAPGRTIAERVNQISGGITFDVEEIEAFVPPEKKAKNGSPVVPTKIRAEAVKTLDVLSRLLQQIDLYEPHIGALSQIRDSLAKA